MIGDRVIPASEVRDGCLMEYGYMRAMARYHPDSETRAFAERSAARINARLDADRFENLVLHAEETE